MTDHASRTAERTATAVGDPVAESQVLVGRLRSGGLARHHLQVAAYCWHAPALLALGIPLRPMNPLRALVAHDDLRKLEDEEYVEWVEPLRDFLDKHRDREAFAREFGVVAIVTAAKALMDEGCGGGEIHQAVVRLGEEWLAASPTNRNLVADKIRCMPEIVVRRGGRHTPHGWCGSVISAVLWITDGMPLDANQGWGTMVTDALLSAGEASAQRAEVRRTIKSALIDWALR